MSKVTYWQRGESLDYINTGTTVIEANTVVALTGRIGIAGTDILPGGKGDLHVSGVFEFDKTGATAIGMGQTVYFDGTGITNTADGNTEAGYAAASVEAADTKVLVKIG